MIKTKLGYFSILGAILIFFIGTNPTSVCAKTELIIEGNVVGYESYKFRLFGTFALMVGIDPVLVKVTKVLEGSEKSGYIKVLTHNFGESYANENYGLGKISTFKLLRVTKCDEKIKGLINSVTTIKIGKQVETYKTFTLFPDFERKSLPLNKKIPCYLVFYEQAN